ncbi:hypothetical protein C7417_1780 [Cupriavidus plantarum]|uniref:DUF6697 domain-containing protein n=1 Tax=Cupriavidus plantarum TaxID=942865 RepID=A0A316F087_9BURK|nr:hypothetical protein C7419_1011803 [Cupriavidus plantarum]RLK45756.1 hypothetical protein C7417_1780 [Cupriavidus plantarum]
MFEIGKDYTREQIHSVCGGSKQAFLPTKNGKVVAICLRPELNPGAPEAIVCSSSAATRAAGRTLASQKEAVPVFIKGATDRYRYAGQFTAAGSLTTPPDCAPYVVNSGFTLGQISRVVRMERVNGGISVSGGANGGVNGGINGAG